jgi:hypothetical protein
MTGHDVSGDIHNPVDVERKIVETKNRIAAGVSIVTGAERAMNAAKLEFDRAQAHVIKRTEGPEYLRKAEATLQTLEQRSKAEDAELSYKHAIRTASALDKELFAWQSILNSVRAMYNAAGVR